MEEGGGRREEKERGGTESSCVAPPSNIVALGIQFLTHTLWGAHSNLSNRVFFFVILNLAFLLTDFTFEVF
jgi:energy-converting hydrogenase Eha subunit A